MDVIAQFFGLIGLFFICFSIQQNNKMKILLFQFLANLFYALQYFSLGAITGSYVCILATIRSIIFNNYAKINKRIPIYIFMMFFFANILIGITCYKSILDLIPIISAIIYTYGIWQNDLKRFRYISSFVAIAWTCYNLLVGAYIASFGTFIELLASIISIYRFDIKKKSN